MLWIGKKPNQELPIFEVAESWGMLHSGLVNRGIIKDTDISGMTETDIMIKIRIDTEEYIPTMYLGRYSIETFFGEPSDWFDNIEEARKILLKYKEADIRNGDYEPLYWRIYDNLENCVVCGI